MNRLACILSRIASQKYCDVMLNDLRPPKSFVLPPRKTCHLQRHLLACGHSKGVVTKTVPIHAESLGQQPPVLSGELRTSIPGSAAESNDGAAAS